MATTTKTLTPTNQTITLPDMTERPNASVLVDGIGKDADAINALSEQIKNTSATGLESKTFYFSKTGRTALCVIPSLSSITLDAWETKELVTIPESMSTSLYSVYFVMPRQLQTTYIPAFIKVSNNKIYIENQSNSSVTTGTIMACTVSWMTN